MSAPASITTETTFGRIGPDDALTAIRAENRRAGVTMSGSDEIATAYQLADALRLDPTTGRTFVVDVAGNEKAGITASDFIAQLQASATLASHTGSTSVSAATTATERAVEKNKAGRYTQAQRKAAEAAALHAQYGNPWHERSINRTRQSVIQNLDPALADRFRNTAGK